MIVKTYEEWKGNLDDYLNPSDVVDQEMVNYFINTLPPATFTSHCIQFGEPANHINGKAVFATLKKTEQGWVYSGKCFRGEAVEPYTVTQKNINLFVHKLMAAVNKTANYNSECFGTSDIQLALAMEQMLDAFIDRLIAAGYSPYPLMNDIMKEYDHWIKETSKFPELKQIADEELSINMSDCNKLLDMCDYIWKQKQTV